MMNDDDVDSLMTMTNDDDDDDMFVDELSALRREKKLWAIELERQHQVIHKLRTYLRQQAK